MRLGVTPLPWERNTFHIIIVVTGLESTDGNLSSGFLAVTEERAVCFVGQC